MNFDGEIFVNIIFDLDNNLLSDPIIFCPTVSDDESLIKEIKEQVSDDLKKLKNFIDDNIMSNELKRNVKLINDNIGLKPLTYIEIVNLEYNKLC